MNTTALDRKQARLSRRQRHIEELKRLGYIYNTMNAIKMVEHQANWYATKECNGELAEGEYEQAEERILNRVKRLFGGTLPKGFFINGDPRGYSLKLDSEQWGERFLNGEYNLPINYQDWGGYMILAPEDF